MSYVFCLKEIGAPSGTRTRDSHIKSVVFCQLNYRSEINWTLIVGPLRPALRLACHYAEDQLVTARFMDLNHIYL